MSTEILEYLSGQRLAMRKGYLRPLSDSLDFVFLVHSRRSSAAGPRSRAPSDTRLLGQTSRYTHVPFGHQASRPIQFNGTTH